MCPICVRKLQVSCGFELRGRYQALGAAYGALGLHDQVRWCREVIERGDAAAAMPLYAQAFALAPLPSALGTTARDASSV